MPFTLQWLNEDRDILVAKYTGKWTWEEVGEVDTRSRALYATAGKRVDCICYMKDTAWVPPQYVDNVQQVSQVRYPNLHLVVYLVQPMMADLIRTFNEKFNKLPYEIAFAETLEAAYLLIVRSRAQG